ncbi:DUF1631 family protein [Amantichitinum ursilacus]|uniref:Thymidine phosphorylase n=1 Tax=Amantichitinum ursilacus TaxID=857265 RepID=A0A0N0GLE2_9NEIS|nr:DUF1631 family protein [Amantichitinum ursilacus]KPC49904.1 hypothetical protein WG78_19200 [Amantichitinum ursilacus]
MDKNEILARARTTFIGAFNDAAELLAPATLLRLTAATETGVLTAAERYTLYEARNVLQKNEIPVRQLLRDRMEVLVNRSFQTAYSTFRPSFADSFAQTTLSLIDTSTQEEELRVDTVTRRYRNTSEQELRDLNIRMAVLFGQEDIKERENPFRPWLFARAISQAVEALGQGPDTATVLTDYLAEEFTPSVHRVYERLNQLLSDEGIGTNLQLKIRRTAQSRPAGIPGQMPQAGAHDDGGAHADSPFAGMQPNPAFAMPGGHADPFAAMAGAQAMGNPFAQAMAQAGNPFAGLQNAFSPDPTDQLLQAVQRAVSGGGDVPGGAADAAVGGSVPNLPQGLPGGMPQLFAHGAFPQGGFGQGGMPQAGFGPATGMPGGLGGGMGGSAQQGFGASPAAGGTAGEAARKSWLSGASGVSDALRHLFSGMRKVAPRSADDLASPFGAPGATDEPLHFDGGADSFEREAAFEPTQFTGSAVIHTPLSGMVEELQYIATPDASGIMENGRVRNLIMEARARLSDVAKDSTEQMVIDTVAMLFEFILSDTEVPAEVRAQLGRLQFLVLKTALLDPDFFTQAHHPARMLVNRIGSISLGLRSLDPSGERISIEIRQIIETLLADKSEGLALFTRMLDEFDAFIARELRSADARVERAVAAVESSENHTLLYARTAGKLGDALSAFRLDTVFHDFLVNAWSHAVERAGRNSPERAHRYRELVPDLVWSIAPKVLPSERKEFLGMIPGMLATLREGMAESGLTREQQTAFLGWLADRHKLALSAASVPAPVPPLDMLRETFAGFVHAPAESEGRDEEAAAFDRAHLAEAIQELDIELDLIDHVLAQESDEAVAAPSAPGDELQNRLQNGVMVEVNLDGKPSIARLNWISTSASTLVLTLEGHEKPSVVSVKLFRRLLDSGRARFIEAAPLFERAVTALMDSADKVDQTPLPLAA